jgi:hypothetical protein
VKLSAPIYHLKRKARSMSRNENIPRHVALDRIAVAEGFGGWSLLAANWAAASASTPRAARLYATLTPGDLVLVGARPRQGKTLLSLELAIEAMKSGNRGLFFSLEYTRQDVLDRFCSIGLDPTSFGTQFTFESSDAISAAYIIDYLQRAPSGTLSVIDYLQLLDQKRVNPDLMTQVRALKRLCPGNRADHRLRFADRPILRSPDQALPRYRRHPPAKSLGPLAVRQDVLRQQGRDAVSDDSLTEQRRCNLKYNTAGQSFNYTYLIY